MESSRQDFFIDMAVDGFILEKKTLSPCFTLIPKTGERLPKTGVSFYWAARSRFQIHDSTSRAVQKSNFELQNKKNLMNWMLVLSSLKFLALQKQQQITQEFLTNFVMFLQS